MTLFPLPLVWAVAWRLVVTFAVVLGTVAVFSLRGWWAVLVVIVGALAGAAWLIRRVDWDRPNG